MEKIEIHGTVKPYRGNGRKLGYPTANIEVADGIPSGVFIGTVVLDGQTLPGMLFVGEPVTLDDHIRRAEAHIIDFEDKDLYGEEIIMTFIEKVRDNKKFDSLEELIVAMKNDENIVRDFFKTGHGKDLLQA